MTLRHHPGVAVRPDSQASPLLDAADLLARLPHPTLPPYFQPSSQVIPLDAAYRECAAITRTHSKSFFFSSQLLPPAKRRAVRALYALCRTSDDLVDQPQGDAAAALAAWVQQIHAPQPPPTSAVLRAWDDTRRQYAIPQALVDELLAGIAMDLTIPRYATFAELWVYCYRVASVVGLLAMQIIGHQPGAAAAAVTLGVALQLTNILRDIGEDARRGRIYLPQEDLARFGVTDADLLAGRRDARVRALLRFEMARAEQLYAEAWPGIALLSADSRLAIGVAAEVYRAILGRIAQNEYDVFTRRAAVPLLKKIQIAWHVKRRLQRESAHGYSHAMVDK